MSAAASHHRPVAPGRRARVRNLVALVLALVAVASFPHGGWTWLAAALIAAATAFGVLHLLGEHEPEGVPIESLLTPAIGAAAVLGAVPALEGLGVANPIATLALALAGGGPLLVRAVGLESRLAATPGEAAPRDALQLELLTLVFALFAFAGVAASVPGGLPSPGSAPGPLRGEPLLVLAASDAAVAFLLGYRLTALRLPVAIEAIWAGGTYAVVIGGAAAVLWTLGLPNPLGPAILTGVLYLWSLYRASSAAQRRQARWIWEYALLAIALAVVVAWYAAAR